MYFNSSKRALPIGYKLPAHCRIKKRKEFLEIQETGTKLYTSACVILYKVNNLAYSRIGVTVSKKVDKRAVIRNKIKRRLRDVFRYMRPSLSGNYDMVFIAKSRALSTDYQDLKLGIHSKLTEQGLLQG